MPTAMAGPDVLNDGDLLEDDVLCKKEKKRRNLVKNKPCHKVKEGKCRKIDKPRFLDALVGMFGGRCVAAWRRHPLGAHH
jgi:hypothetical protein